MARALDAVGDRWTLLVVRELLVRECRFSELRRGLPGVASNLLAERLRDLEAEGLVGTVEADGIVRYALTPRGQALAPVVHELARWGAPAMAAGPNGDQEQGQWLVIAIAALLDGPRFRGSRPLTVQFNAGGVSVWLRLEPGTPHTAGLGHVPDPDVTVSGTLHECLAALLGSPGHDGAEVTGDVRRWRAVAATRRTA